MARSIVSYDWLVAETEAWPLSSWAAYELGTVQLVQASSGILSGETERLANKLEEWLRPRARGMTLEVLRQIRDSAWFGQEDREASLVSYLIRLAHRYLESQGNRLCLRADAGIGTSERAGRWRWLSYLLPEDLLIAACAAGEGIESRGEHVHLPTPHLERILNECKFAETHLHVGAAVPFPLLWTALVVTIAEDPPRQEELERGGPPPFDSGKAFLGKLLAAAIARLIMASFLEQRDRRPREGDFERFCCSQEGGLAQVASRIVWHESPAHWKRITAILPGMERTTARGQVLQTLAYLGWKEGSPPLPPTLALYRKLLVPRTADRPQAGSDVIACLDPLAAWLGPAKGTALPETRFAARAIRYLREDGKGDRLFQRIFWQYQRVRCMTFRHLVEEPGTGGLDWFSRHYQRISVLRKGLDETIYRCALESESVDVCLEALEARTAPPGTWPEVYREIGRLAEQAIEFGQDHGKVPEVALIFHFIKEREDKSRKCLHADPGPSGVFGCRFGSWFHSRLRQAFAIECALHRDPEILLLLRGIDVANAELAVPTWACLPLFERVRRASIHAAERLARRRSEWRASPLQVTCHLGEDFVRLVQGLRRIHEPIEFGLLSTGARIGHAVALGTDPGEWISTCTTLPQTKEERLDDLLWELDRYGCGDVPPFSTGRLEFVRHQIAKLSRDIYGNPCSPDDLLLARRYLHSPRCLEEFGYPYIRRPERHPGASVSALDLLWRYLTDASVFKCGQEKIEVQADEHEVAFLRCAQQWLRQLLGRLEITVESNPSSNLLIGELRSLDEHPAFRLLPLISSRTPEESPVMLSVNVDDPVTFASHLANEFAHIYFALTRRKVSSEDALAWLSMVREHGWRSRFTLKASQSESNLRRFSPPFTLPTP